MIQKEQLKRVRKELETFLSELGQKEGLVFNVGAMTYNDTEFTFKTEAKVGGSVEEVERKEFAKNSRLFEGIIANDYLREIEFGGRKMKIVGLKPRSPKFGVIAESVATGQRYKLGTKGVIKKLNDERFKLV